MSPHMALENEIVNTVRLSYGLKLEAVAFATGYSTSHVARIMTGEARVTIDFLRAFYAKFPSPLLIKLVVPDYQPPEPSRPQRTAPDVVPVLPHPRKAISHLCALMREMASLTEKTDAIVADGEVSEHEADAISASLQHAAKVQAGLSLYCRSMTAWLDESRKGKGVRP